MTNLELLKSSLTLIDIITMPKNINNLERIIKQFGYYLSSSEIKKIVQLITWKFMKYSLCISLHFNMHVETPTLTPVLAGDFSYTKATCVFLKPDFRESPLLLQP